MIKSFDFDYVPSKIIPVGPNFYYVREYSKFCANYDKLLPEEKIELQISKYYVWKVEINSIERLIHSNNLTDIEKMILEDQQSLLQNEAWKCREEIYLLYQSELSQKYPEADKFLKKIEGAHISLDKPFVKRNIDSNKYFKLSPIEKIGILISQSSMLSMEEFALCRRRDSKKLHDYENLFLNYRVNILYKCMGNIQKCITVIFYEEFKRDTPGVEKLYSEISRAGYYIYPECRIDGKEDFRYPYDFKRPNEVLPEEWGSPEIDWRTGADIPYDKRYYSLQ